MKSYKSLGITLISAALAVLLSAIGINQFYMNPLFHQSYEMREIILAYDVLLGELSLPIGVMQNIATQYETNPDLHTDIEKKARLDDAYNDKLKLLNNHQNKIEGDVNTLIKTLESISRIPFIDKTEEFKNIQSYTLIVNRDLTRSKELINRLGSSGDQANVQVVNSLEYEFEQIKIHTDYLLRTMTTWNKTILDLHMKIINRLYFIMLIFSIILAFLLIRILRGNMAYVLNGMRMISQFDTDLTKLPAFTPYFEEEKKIAAYVDSIFTEQKFLNELKEYSNQYFVLDDILDLIFNKIQGIFPATRLGIAFIDNDNQKVVAEYAICNYTDVRLKSGYEVSLHHSRLGQMVRTKKAYFDNDILQELMKRPHSSSLRLIAEEGIRSNMVIPLLDDNEVFGFLFFSSNVPNSYNESTLQMGLNISHELSSIINKTYLTKKMLAMVTQTFARLVEEKDTETGDHINRMTSYATMIANGLLNHENERYRVNLSFVKDIQNDAPIHDIGKVGIPDSILKKNGRLTEEEFDAMKMHAQLGGDILSSMQKNLKHFKVDFYQTAYDITTHHHEKWDGSGYPDGLKGEEIPLAARIVAIADVFDALVSKRVYKDPIAFEKAIDIIKEGSGKHFDPVLVDIFMEKLPQVQQVYQTTFLDSKSLFAIKGGKKNENNSL